MDELFFYFYRINQFLCSMLQDASRRLFLRHAGMISIAGAAGIPLAAGSTPSSGVVPPFPSRVRLSLNCYSFNTPLRAGEITLFDVLEFCAKNNIDAIDPTGYYFPGYPEVPENEYISRFKRQAFLLGIDISGTGVRNDFTVTDPEQRKKEVDLVKRWIEAAARMGAPTLRIFAGVTQAEGYSREQVFEWMARDIRECCIHAEKFGVVLCLQNHWDYIKSADDILTIFGMVDSAWLGLNLDIGSYRYDVYSEIQRTIHLAVTWQIKENIYIDGQPVKTNYARILKMIDESGYRGYIPLETLGPGDPFTKLEKMLSEVRSVMHGS